MAFANPTSNLAQFGLAAGLTVADLGAGSGFYTLAAARAVGSTGKVYAIEVQKDLLDKVKKEATREGLHNVEVVWGDIEKHAGTHLRDESIDRAIISNVLFQAQDKEDLVAEAKRILKQNGKALVIDWSDSADISGPDPKHLVQVPAARAFFEKKGFTIEGSIQAGAHHYGFIAIKK